MWSLWLVRTVLACFLGHRTVGWPHDLWAGIVKCQVNQTDKIDWTDCTHVLVSQWLKISPAVLWQNTSLSPRFEERDDRESLEVNIPFLMGGIGIIGWSDFWRSKWAVVMMRQINPIPKHRYLSLLPSPAQQREQPWPGPSHIFFKHCQICCNSSFVCLLVM